MNPSIARRMTKLESAARPRAGRIELIVRRIVSTDGGETHRAIYGEAVLERHPNEGDNDFIERAESQALAATDSRPGKLTLLPRMTQETAHYGTRITALEEHKNGEA